MNKGQYQVGDFVRIKVNDQRGQIRDTFVGLVETERESYDVLTQDLRVVHLHVRELEPWEVEHV